MRQLIIVLSVLTLCQTIWADEELFADGHSAYSIVLSDDASMSERTAAKELQTVFREMSGATLPVVSTPISKNKNIYIGWCPQTGVLRPADADESFQYKTIGDNLYIFGGREHGSMYGVFRFLERELGVHWYTSSFTKIPQQRRFILGTLNHSESPVIHQRFDFYYDALRHRIWAAHNLLNTQYLQHEGEYGKMSSYWGIHTFHTLMPPSVYFKAHPEYYSIHKGKRTDKAQLCLSNKNMRRELIRNLLDVIARNPGYWCYDVSQNDNTWPCECKSCRELVKKYGGHSGAMIWFVNQVADEVKKIYPNIYIGTFAYQYTRQAPQSRIRPADNVVVRLCDIECCMAHPLEGCGKNRSFLADMNSWCKIARNIYIWDYTTGFQNYLLPFPNFDVLAANFRYFSQSNVVGVLEEGSHNAPWSEFSELKQWLIAKLLWNPRQDVDSLAALFISDYYGKAAPFVWQYYELCKKQVTDDTHFTIGIDWKANIYSGSFIGDGTHLMEKALASVKGSTEELKRTRRVAAQLYYLKLRKNGLKSSTDGTVQLLKELAEEDETLVAESGQSLGNMLKSHHYY